MDEGKMIIFDTDVFLKGWGRTGAQEQEREGG